jgi:hypothetical protein
VLQQQSELHCSLDDLMAMCLPAATHAPSPAVSSRHLVAAACQQDYSKAAVSVRCSLWGSDDAACVALAIGGHSSFF